MKASGIGCFYRLDDRRIVLGAERVGFVVDDIKAGRRQELLADIGELRFRIRPPRLRGRLCCPAVRPLSVS